MFIYFYMSNIMSIQNNTVMSTDDWQKFVGDQFRAMRIRADLEQTELATRADVSVGAIKNLENGKGSSLRTLIRVCRALRRTDWLEALAPPVTVSPMDMLRKQGQGKEVRMKVFRPRVQAAKG